MYRTVQQSTELIESPNHADVLSEMQSLHTYEATPTA